MRLLPSACGTRSLKWFISPGLKQTPSTSLVFRPFGRWSVLRQSADDATCTWAGIPSRFWAFGANGQQWWSQELDLMQHGRPTMQGWGVWTACSVKSMAQGWRWLMHGTPSAVQPCFESAVNGGCGKRTPLGGLTRPEVAYLGVEKASWMCEQRRIGLCGAGRHQHRVVPRRHWLGPVKPAVAQQVSTVIVDEATAKSAFRMDMVVASSPLWTLPGWCWSTTSMSQLRGSGTSGAWDPEVPATTGEEVDA